MDKWRTAWHYQAMGSFPVILWLLFVNSLTENLNIIVNLVLTFIVFIFAVCCVRFAMWCEEFDEQ